jgi:hypothetical protein
LGSERSPAQLLLNIETADVASTSYRIDGLRNTGTIRIGHHVPGILNEVQDGTRQRPVKITRLFRLD